MGRHARHAKQRVKLRTAKTIDKITYTPSKHKQKSIRKLRKELRNRQPNIQENKQDPVPSLKFGSFNVNGMDTEVCEAIQHLIKERHFDVST